MTDITENGKYYIATAEDFVNGLSYEVIGLGVYEHDALDVDNNLFNYVEEGIVRIKHLDHDDIVECGFKQEEKNYYLIPSYDKHQSLTIHPEKIITLTTKNTRFSGYIRNKSELQRIMRQIGITV